VAKAKPYVSNAEKMAKKHGTLLYVFLTTTFLFQSFWHYSRPIYKLLLIKSILKKPKCLLR